MATITIQEPLDSRVELVTNTMTITELDGLRRTVVLSCSSMPKKGASWGGEQRVPTHFPPGSSQGTQQVLGPKPKETSFTGVWRRTWLGRHPVVLEQDGSETNIIAPATVRALFDDIMIRGSLLSVTWQSITRQGRMSSFNTPIDTIHDIQWEASFSWISLGSEFPVRVVRVRNGGEQALIDGLLLDGESIGTLDGVSIAVSDRPPRSSSIPNLTIGQVNALLNAPNTLMQSFSRNVRELTSKVKQVADLYNTFRNQPALVANTMLATAENIVAQCNQFQDEVTRDPAEAQGYDGRVSSLLNTFRYYSEGYRLSEAIKNKAQDLRDSQARRADVQQATAAQMDIIAIHVVREGDTLMGVSVRYYGTIDNAETIAKANSLQYPVVMATTEDGKLTLGGKNLLMIPSLKR